MTTRIVKIHLDSQYSQNNSTDTPLFYMQTPLNVRGFKLSSVAVPNSVYTVNSTNNSFTVTESGVPRTVTLPQGNYSSSQLATQLQTSLGGAYAVTFNSIKYTLSITNSGSFKFTFPLGNGSYRILGFPSTFNQAEGTSLTSPSAINLGGANYLLLVSNGLKSQDNILVGNQGINILGKINNSVNSGNIIFQEYDTMDWTKTDCTLTSFQLSLLSSDTLTPISLNGLPFSCTLTLLVENE